MLDYSSLTPGQAATDAIRKAAADVGFESQYRAKLRLTGPVPIGLPVPTLLTTSVPSLCAVSVAGRQWLVTLRAEPPFIAERRHGRRAWMVLATGLCLTALLGAYLSALLSRTATVERRVQQRTSQLTNEVNERRRAEDLARTAEANYRGIFDNSVEGIFQTTIDFAAGTASNGSPSTVNSANLFDPALLGLADFADVLSLSNLTGISGHPDESHLLILSQESGKTEDPCRSETNVPR